MRKTRVIAFVVASLVSSASILGAQSPGGQGSGAGRHAMGGGMGPGARGLMRGITLTDAEKARLKEIHAKYRAEGETLRDSLRDASDRAREKVRVLRERERAEIRSALSPENQQQLDANVRQTENRRADRARRGEGKRGDNRGHRGRRAGRLG